MHSCAANGTLAMPLIFELQAPSNVSTAKKQRLKRGDPFVVCSTPCPLTPCHAAGSNHVRPTKPSFHENPLRYPHDRANDRVTEAWEGTTERLVGRRLLSTKPADRCPSLGRLRLRSARPSGTEPVKGVIETLKKVLVSPRLAWPLRTGRPSRLIADTLVCARPRQSSYFVDNMSIMTIRCSGFQS